MARPCDIMVACPTITINNKVVTDAIRAKVKAGRDGWGTHATALYDMIKTIRRPNPKTDD